MWVSRGVDTLWQWQYCGNSMQVSSLIFILFMVFQESYNITLQHRTPKLSPCDRQLWNKIPPRACWVSQPLVRLFLTQPENRLRMRKPPKNINATTRGAWSWSFWQKKSGTRGVVYLMAGRLCQTQKRNESKATMESLMPVSTMNPVEEIFSRKLLSHFTVRKAFTFHWRMVHPKIKKWHGPFFSEKKKICPTISTWWFKVTFLGMVKWPF